MSESKEKMEEYFVYLDALRESGATNMFGATPYLVRDFSMSQQEAKSVLGAWMEQFGERKSA